MTAAHKQQLGMELGLCVYLTTHSDIPMRRGDIQMVSFVLVAHSARLQYTEAPTTHDKPGSLTCPVYNTKYTGAFSCDEEEHISI